MTTFTASAAERVIACPASEALPHSEREDTEARTRGSEIHHFLESAATVGVDRALAFVPDDYVEICAAIDVSNLPLHLTHEVKYALNVRTGKGRIIGYGSDREYGELDPYEIAGTIDIVGISDDAVFVGDYKTGWRHTTDAQMNPQLLTAACALCDVYDKDKAIVDLTMVRENASAWHDRATVEAFDLEVFRVMLGHAVEVVAQYRAALLDGATDIEVTEGEHCRYCPAFDACPAKQALALDIESGELAVHVESQWAGNLTAETAPQAYLLYKRARALVKRMGEIITAYAAEHPIEFEPGKVFGPKQKRGRAKLDGDIVHGELVKLWGQEVADVAVKRTATMKGIDAAIRKVDDDQKLADRKRCALAAIEGAGGLDRKPTFSLEEYEVEREAEADTTEPETA